MKNFNTKTADDVIVPDGDEGMRRLAEATRRIISIHKPKRHRKTKAKSRK